MKSEKISRHKQSPGQNPDKIMLHKNFIKGLSTLQWNEDTNVIGYTHSTSTIQTPKRNYTSQEFELKAKEYKKDPKFKTNHIRLKFIEKSISTI